MAERILIVDDHAIVREGIRNLIVKLRPEWQICGEAGDGEEAQEKARLLKPTVVILDITMPKFSGLEAAARISQLSPESRILMFTMHESARLNLEAQQAGAHGMVLKSQATRDLIRAIDRLISGNTFFEQIGEKEEIRSIPNKKQHFERSALWSWKVASRIFDKGGELLDGGLSVTIQTA